MRFCKRMKKRIIRCPLCSSWLNYEDEGTTYHRYVCRKHGDIYEVMLQNIEKLKKRYPGGFDVERANNREGE